MLLMAGDNVNHDKLQPGDIDFGIKGPKRPSWDELKEVLDAIQNAESLQMHQGRKY